MLRTVSSGRPAVSDSVTVYAYSAGISALHRCGCGTGRCSETRPSTTGARTVSPFEESDASPASTPSMRASTHRSPSEKSSVSSGFTQMSAKCAAALVNSATLRKMPDMRQKSWSSSQLADEKRNTRTARRFSPPRRTAGVKSNSAGGKLSSL